MNPKLKITLIARAKKKGLNAQQTAEYVRLMSQEIEWIRRNKGKKE